MGKELVVSSDRHETKVAILEDGQLVEVYFQRANEYSLAGSIHKGRVTRVLPGMQSAFVDLGLERDTFLYVSDFTEESGEDVERIQEDGRGKHHPREAAPPQVAVAAAAPVAGSIGEPPPHSGEGDTPPRENRDGRRFDNDRRGGRRRRRGGGRFPESKFASAPESSVPEERAAEAPTDETVEPILLPGESLRKYRREETHTDIVPDAVSESDTEEPETAVQFVAPVPEPDAPIHHPVVEEGELMAETVAEIDESEPEEVDTIDAESREDDTSDVSELPTVEESEQEDEPGQETEIEAATEQQGEGQAAQPALEPMGYSAHLRDQPGRFLQQRSGRRRRRGRGRDDRGADRTTEQRGGERQESRPEARPETRPEARKEEGQQRAVQPLITELLKEGQEILVQIAKEPLGQKGARITSHIALPGRYCVYMPTVEHTGVSRKIASDEERQRLKRILQTHKQGIPGGFILRTAGEGKTESDIAADIHYLYNLWLDIRQKAEKRKAPALIYHDLDIVERTLRDQLSEDFKAIWCDSEEKYESVLQFVQRVQPSLVGRVKMFTRPVPIFDAFSVATELEKALRPKVWLKSGGYIVINQTEALVAIDINTGKFVGKSNRLEDTIVKINTEAVKEIVRQIRLRDLGGIIVIDFIDMDERKNRQKVMQALEEAMRADRAPYKILQFNDFGLVAITRKRVKQSLERTLCQPCPHCEGSGYIKSVQTIIGDIIVEARKIAGAVEGKDCLLRVNPDVAKVLQSTKNTYLEELEEILKRPVGVIADGVLHHEKFDLS